MLRIPALKLVQRQVVTLPDLTGPNLRVGRRRLRQWMQSAPPSWDDVAWLNEQGAARSSARPAHNAECLCRETSRARAAKSIAG
jgi:hypothetical protein